jgi:hemerythrin-like domain-containing protein
MKCCHLANVRSSPIADKLLQCRECPLSVKTVGTSLKMVSVMVRPARQLVSAMQAFITIYRPHAAREDTDLFPKLKDVVSPHEYDAMAEDFEKKEHALFGDDGFEKMVDRVAKLEQAIGIRFPAR